MKRLISVFGLAAICAVSLEASGVATHKESVRSNQTAKDSCCRDPFLKRNPQLDEIILSEGRNCNYSLGLNADFLSFQKEGRAYATFSSLALSSVSKPTAAGQATFNTDLQPGLSAYFRMMDQSDNTGLDITVEYIHSNYEDQTAVSDGNALMSTYAVDPSALGNIQVVKAVGNFQPSHLAILCSLRKASVQYGGLALNATAGLGYENNVYEQNLDYFASEEDHFVLYAKNNQRLFTGSVQVGGNYKIGYSDRLALVATAEFRPMIGALQEDYTNHREDGEDLSYRYNISDNHLILKTMQKATIGLEYLFDSTIKARDLAGKVRVAYIAEYRPDAFNAAPQVMGAQAESIFASGLQAGATIVF